MKPSRRHAGTTEMVITAGMVTMGTKPGGRRVEGSQQVDSIYVDIDKVWWRWGNDTGWVTHLDRNAFDAAFISVGYTSPSMRWFQGIIRNPTYCGHGVVLLSKRSTRLQVKNNFLRYRWHQRMMRRSPKTSKLNEPACEPHR